MGHRHIPNTSQIFEVDQDWGHGHPATGRSQVHIGRAVAPQNQFFSHPIDNISTSGFDCASRRTLEVEHSSTNIRLEGPQVHPSLSGPSPDIIPHFPAGGSFYPAPESNAGHAHTSHYNRHIIHEVEGGLLDRTMDTRRGPFKRKSPGISVSWERGSTSNICGAGSSSNSLEPHPEKPTSGYRSHSSSSIGLPSYVGASLSIGAEDSPRNVRSRCRLDLDSNPRRNLPGYSSQPCYPASHLQNHPGPVDVANFNADSAAYEQSSIGVSPSAHESFQSSANNFLSLEMNQYYVGRSPADNGGYQHESILSRNPVAPPRYLHGFDTLAAGEGYSNHSRRATPLHRTGLSFSSPFGQEVAASDNVQQFFSETYPSRYPRPLSIGGSNNNYREGRSRMAIERFQSLSNVMDARDRMGSEAPVMLDHSYFYGSRNLFDHYRHMRLDIDNMSYEELLALGERIGNVNTGLSEDMISKCLMETMYPSSDKNQEETSCAICLEEYKNMDKVGTMKNCRHGYHVDCIKKWLSMKNACPICKAPAVAESSNKD